MVSVDVRELTWKWRCKLLGTGQGASDYTSSSSSSDADPKSGTAGPDGDAMGSSPTVKTFYEGKGSSMNHYNWVDYPPRQLSKKAAKAQDRVSIKVYKVKDDTKPMVAGTFPLRYHMLTVQNLALAQALEDVLKKEDVHLDSNDAVTFKEPFQPLWFCYDDILAKCKSLGDADPLKAHMQLFIRILDDVFGEIRIKKQNLEAAGLISFKLAWMFFPRDITVVTWRQGCEVLFKCESTSYRLGSFHIKGKTLAFNGESFVWEDGELAIAQFGGNRPITELPHFPVKFSDECAEIKARLKARGNRVLDFQGLHHCSYTGIGFHQKGMCVEKHNVTGRILVDTVGYNKHHLAAGNRNAQDPQSKKNIVAGTGRPAGENKPAAPTKHLTEEEQEHNKEVMRQNEDDLMYLSPLVEGYSLKNKLWLSFFIDDVAPVKLNEEAFDHLVYDPQQKDLVYSFVENHASSKNLQVEDVIVDKGVGLVVLLSGPPGTGKTLMAEAVADRSRRPLLYLHAEDLGISAASLGTRLKEIMAMATEWNAVILLDECDVFLAERHPGDIARNELVSIFLRELEYFRGIIFLTTNLYSTIDAAFRSRVSLHLLFKPLTKDARFAIWKKFLDRLPGALPTGAITSGEANTNAAPATTAASVDSDKTVAGSGEEAGWTDLAENTAAAVGVPPPVDLNEEDVKELADWHLNGREIQNAVKMVNNWCQNKSYAVTLARLESGIKVTSPQASKTTTQGGDDTLYD